MSNLHQLSAIAKQRKKRTLWRNLVVCFAALVVFCTTYALILPAITMEQEGYSCGLQEHTHTPDCYRLTCGKQEAYTHTHTKPDCYDADGNLTCTLKEQTLHRHTQDCYSQPQPICGQEPCPAHQHSESCYTDGVLTCTQPETPGHTHTQDCCPAEFTPELICGQQELPEHRHTAACYTLTCQQQEHTHTESCISSHQAFLNSIQEATQEATQPQEANQPEEVTQPEAVTEPQEATQPEEATEPQEPTQPEAVTEPQVVTQPQEPTQPETVTEPQEPSQEEEPPQEEEPILPGAAQPPVMLLAPAAPATVAENAENTGSVNLVDVATSWTVSSNSAEYVPGSTYINGQWVDGAYNMTFNLAFDVKTAGDPGNRHIIDRNGNSVSGTVFTYNLGIAELGQNVKYGTKYEFNPTLGNSTYHFVKNESDGTITVVIDLDDAYVKADNLGDITGRISVAAIVGKEDGKEDGSVEHDTEGNIKIKVDADKVTYPENETNKGKVEVSKTGSFTFEGDKLLYTVVVSSGGKGTPGPVTILDTFSFDGAALKITGPEEVKVDGKNHTDYKTTNSTGKTDISMTLPQLKGSETHTITYVFTVTERPETSTLVKNKVHVESRPEGEGKPVKAEKEIPVTVPDKDAKPQISLSKSRPWIEDDSMVIPWEIKFNYTKMDITGKVLEDSYTVSKSNGETETITWDFNKAINDTAHPMTVEVNGVAIPKEQFAQHFTVQPDGSLKFTGTEEAPNKNAYKITYYMPTKDYNSQWGVTSVKNKAKVGELEATADDWKSNNNSVQKSSQGVEAAENGQVRMKWKTDINVTNVGFKKDDVIHDNTNPNNSAENLHYFDRTSIQISYNGTAWTENEDYRLEFYDHKDGEPTDGNATYMQVVLLNNIPAQGGYQQDLLTMEYTTFANSHEAKTYKNTATFYNTAGDAQQEVVPDSIIKADGNGITGTTKVENFNGELTWKITAKIGDITKTRTVTVTDALPSNVEVRELSVVSKLANGADQNAALTIAPDGTISGENSDFTFSGTCQKNEQSQNVVTLTATRKGEQNIEANSTITLNLDCCLAQDFVAGNDKANLVNTAEGKTDKGAIGNATHTQEWTKKKENVFENALSKELISDLDGHNYLEYQVQINPQGKDLQPDSAEVYLVDDFSYNPQKGRFDLVFELERDSVKLYKAKLQEDGTLVKGDALTAGWRMVLSESDPTGDFSNAKITKTMRLAVPDETPLILEYRYELTGYKEGSTNVWLEATNRAYFLTEPSQGSGDQSINDNWPIIGTSGGLITDRHIKIVKVDESNSKVVIPGTEFTLQEWKNDTWSNVTTVTQPLTTGRDGSLTVKGFGDKPEDKLHYNVLYRLIETAPAPGYLLDRANPPTVEFYYHNESQTAPAGYPDWNTVPKDSAVDLSQNSATHYITNKAESAQFSVKKLWKYKGGAPVTNPPEATFQLWQVATEKKQDVVVNDPLASTVTVNVSKGMYGRDTAPVPHRVKKGDTVKITATAAGMSKPVAYVYPLTLADWQGNEYPLTRVGNTDTWTYEFTAQYNVNVVILSKTNDLPALACDYPGQSTGGTTGGSTPSTEYQETPLDYTITLNATNNWTWNSEDYRTEDGKKLPIHGTTEDGKAVWYSYYVRENNSGNYGVTYSPSKDGKPVAITSGTITVTNTLPPPPANVSVTVNKTWAGLGEMENTSVNFKLIRKAWESQEAFQASGGADTYSDYGVKFEMTAEQIAALESGTLFLEGEYTLTKNGGWTWTKSNLPGGADGKYYTYFVVEQPGDYYTATYTPQVHDGVITVTNITEKKPTEIQVNKQWFNHLDTSTDAPTGTDSVEFTLYRIAQVDGQPVEGQTEYGPFYLTKAGNWTWNSKTAGLNLLAMEYIDGHAYTYSYYVQETIPENAGYKATYGIVDDMAGESPTVIIKDELALIQSGTLVIRNTLDSPKYQLPQTGGTGTAPLRLAGLILALTAACLLHRKRKTRPQ